MRAGARHNQGEEHLAAGGSSPGARGDLRRASGASHLPARKPDSKEPWDAFLGKAAHLAIGRQYRVQHPTNVVFLDTVSLYNIVRRARLGDPERLAEFVRLLRPDITDTRALVLFEIKPDDVEGSLLLEFENGGALVDCH